MEEDRIEKEKKNLRNWILKFVNRVKRGMIAMVCLIV
jgi:hypothetical protein